MADLLVANTILAQLGGGGRLRAMLGAETFVGSENSLSFRFKARAKNGSNGLYVRLDPSDTYTVEFVSVRASKRTVKASFEDVYAEDLRRLFESETGLYLSL
jgi:hypothetical protein